LPQNVEKLVGVLLPSHSAVHMQTHLDASMMMI
jgi:hypothetical protein